MNCELCGEPMPEGEEMFKLHGYSGPCPKPPLPSKPTEREPYSRSQARRLMVQTGAADDATRIVAALEAENAKLQADVQRWMEVATRRATNLEAQLAVARELLREVEWVTPQLKMWTYCPVCENLTINDHTADCRLAAFLKEADDAPMP
jgi:hypothetical protein